MISNIMLALNAQANFELFVEFVVRSSGFFAMGISVEGWNAKG